MLSTNSLDSWILFEFKNTLLITSIVIQMLIDLER